MDSVSIANIELEKSKLKLECLKLALQANPNRTAATLVQDAVILYGFVKND